MSNSIINAAPMTVLRGTQDMSKRTPVVEAEARPTHLPKIYLYAQKGPTTPQLVVGDSRTQMYGDDTFDLRKPYANHQTVLSNLVNAQANAQMIERILPPDSKEANFTLWCDIISTKIPVYTRGADGNYVLDANGLPTTSGAPALGYSIIWSVTSSDVTTGNTFGTRVSTVSTQTSTEVGTTGNKYPILEFKASSHGAIFNLSGIRVWAPTLNDGVDTAAMSTMGVYPFRMAVIRKATATATASIVTSEYGEQNFDFCLKANTINPASDAKYSLGDIFLDKYQNLKDTRFPIKYGDFGAIKVYQSNIDLVIGLVYAAEKANAVYSYDLAAASGEEYKTNIFSGKNSNGVPYQTLKVSAPSAGQVLLTSTTNVFAGGGADGTMTVANYNDGVTTKVSGYNDPTSQLLNTAVNVESIIYDSGFPIAVKYALCKFIAIRKNTFVVLSTFDATSQTDMSASEEQSMATALKTRLQMYPESDSFGTSADRGMIIGRYGELRNSQYVGKLPLTLEIASKAAAMMGSGDGVWKAEMLFDRAPNNQISLFDANTVNVTFTPSSVRNKDWDVGLNWVQSFSRKDLFFPALKTIYDNDTSVLNSFFTAMCQVELQTVGEQVWREFSGNVSLTGEQLIDKVNARVQELIAGRFAGMFKIVPAAQLTDADKVRGYSWTLPIKLYANGLTSVMTLSVQAYRMSDYVAA